MNNKRKYQVFISSTYIDLVEEREAAVEAVLKAGHIPAGMELFKAGEGQLKTIKKWIDESDIYMLILGKRYGTIDIDTGTSYTELEYRYALEKDMPVFAVLINEKRIIEKENALEENKEYRERMNLQKFQDFENYVKDNKVVSFADNLSDVKLAIHENINQFEDEYNMIGWIRGDEALDVNRIEELYSLQVENEKLRKEISDTKSMSEYDNLDLVDVETIYSFKVKYKSENTKREYVVEMKWKDIFHLIAPFLIKHTADSIVNKNLANFIKDMKKIYGYGFSVDLQDFYTIRVQLEAYGLVKIENLKTTKGDMNIFWIISERGKDYMLDNRVIKN